MHLSLSRRFNEDKLAWLEDLQERVHLNYRSRERWGYDRNFVHPQEHLFVNEVQDEFKQIADLLKRQGWISLGMLDTIEHVAWLVQQPSWIVLDVPFGYAKKGFTRDPITDLKFRMKFRRHISDEELVSAIQSEGWSTIGIPWQPKTFSDTFEKWCAENCTDIYVFRELRGLDNPARQLVFIDRDDALRFKLSGIGVDS